MKNRYNMSGNFLINVVNKYAILRKSLDYARHIPRMFKRRWVEDVDYYTSPPVLANSFPKSGTHLLLQILKALPDIKHYGTFIASKPSLTFQERSEKKHTMMLGKIIPGEVVPAHLFYNTQYKMLLDKKNCAHFFIYRDLRDVVVSEAYYLTKMNKWHRLHRVFASLDNMNERISTAILGIKDDDFPVNYPNIAERFSRYSNWISTPHVTALKYEDLISTQKRVYLREIAEHYDSMSSRALDIEVMINAMEDNIQPEKSHTYRKGIVGGWKKAFTEEHTLQMKEVAGSLLIELGYEDHADW